ncbi:hypothetical protein L484_022531 [Morus notabilis]|uniref:Uncharacterized protein n=1 Tax=Morus notabilis TaxID=981085 RepID=W9QUI2_9ROSA|nr:hypothetical protein L484_022531 [Morus notabilis]
MFQWFRSRSGFSNQTPTIQIAANLHRPNSVDLLGITTETIEDASKWFRSRSDNEARRREDQRRQSPSRTKF